ncbi:septum formation initiator family protein [Chelatococcus sambhunathii]|uniref:Septum formation initiator family protein n=1 Tax=Chelatococcus sambhunathii TaxID=363953 RepID=A0ABU1DEG2_9HYPH|nr:septum formation initiator family protein [Chelatococcus sambhunathii]MDR4306489.1 septum formation initiator family protein [Chelatococcus sambhunathii]
MIVRTKWRIVVAQVALWLVAAGAVTYFSQQAYVGDHGLVASRAMEAEIAQLQARLDAVKVERAAVEHRIDLLSTERIDPDLLDEQARSDLGWISPNERVLQRE